MFSDKESGIVVSSSLSTETLIISETAPQWRNVVKYIMTGPPSERKKKKNRSLPYFHNRV